MSDDARHVAFPQPSGEPREMTITRQRIALHVAENAKRFIRPVNVNYARGNARHVYQTWHRGEGEGEGEKGAKSTAKLCIENARRRAIINESRISY